ncbi:MAG: hypothetical protein CMJ46_00990, partial [Planctomyces sp.]|nr:hypothetical protein [Planctomyces sp.]
MVSGAALAYYTIFSLPPLLVIVFAIAGWFGVNESKIDSMVKEQLGIPITEVAGTESGGAESNIQENEEEQQAGGAMSNLAGVGWIMRIIGIGILIFSATGLFAQFQYALNKAWEVEPDPEQGGIAGFITKRLLSLGMVAIIAFLLLVSLVLTTVVDEIVRSIQGSAPGTAMLAIGIV